MALTVQPPALGMQASAPTLVKPVDLQPALDRLHNAFKEGQITAQDIQKRTELGNSDAEAQRKENEARGAKAEQDRKDQEGGKGYQKRGRFARLLGIGGSAPATPAPAGVEPKNNPAATAALPVDVAPRAPVIPVPGASTGQTPTAAPGAGNTPFLAAASADDFNPLHESTDDLLSLVGEAGYGMLS